MIHQNNASMLRGLILAVLLGVSLAGCATDQRVGIGRIDLAKLRKIDWTPWDKTPKKDPAIAAEGKPAAAPQQATAAAPSPAPVLAPRPAPAPQLIPPPQRSAPCPRTGNSNCSMAAMPRAKPFNLSASRVKTPATPVAHSRVIIPEERPATAPQGKVTQAEIPQAVAVLTPDAKPPRTGKPGRYSPENLVGLDGATVERILGKPDLSRQEPFAEVWQYTHGECVLFLFFYPGEGGTAKVSHAETGARDGGKNPDPAACIGAVAARQTAAPGG